MDWTKAPELQNVVSLLKGELGFRYSFAHIESFDEPLDTILAVYVPGTLPGRQDFIRYGDGIPYETLRRLTDPSLGVSASGSITLGDGWNDEYDDFVEWRAVNAGVPKVFLIFGVPLDGRTTARLYYPPEAPVAQSYTWLADRARQGFAVWN